MYVLRAENELSMPPYKSGNAKCNVISTRVTDTTLKKIDARRGRKSISAYLDKLIDSDNSRDDGSTSG